MTKQENYVNINNVANLWKGRRMEGYSPLRSPTTWGGFHNENSRSKRPERSCVLARLNTALQPENKEGGHKGLHLWRQRSSSRVKCMQTSAYANVSICKRKYMLDPFLYITIKWHFVKNVIFYWFFKVLLL